jgi:GT2 family glycosyltransferase
LRPDAIIIIVLNWNHGEETVGCLESLAAADLKGARVLVVDNGSRDDSIARIRGRFPAQRILELPENLGYAGGNNAGMRVALEEGAEGVLLLNNDARVAPDFIVSLLWGFDIDPRVAAVSSIILRRDNPKLIDVAYSEVRFDTRSVVCLRGVNVEPHLGFDTRREVEVAVGCSLLIRADVLKEIGLFDEAYFAYHEDVDWCLRARKAGYVIRWEPYSVVYHGGSRSTRRLAEPPPPPPGQDVLPNSDPPPWNPVRAYLGARNVVRLLERWATPEQRKEFRSTCFRELPLEYLAIVMGREGWMILGRWSWRQMFASYFVERHAWLARRGRLARALALLVLVPFDLLWSFPRDAWRAWRSGRTASFGAQVRGLWDGYRRRPLPLERLRLR